MTMTRTLVFSTAVVAALGFAAAPQPAHALGTGAAVGIGLGAFALGSAIGASANPYYGYSGYYGPGYYGIRPITATAGIRIMPRAAAGIRITAPIPLAKMAA